MERLTKVMHCDDGNKLYDYSNEVVREYKDFSSRLELMFEKLAEYEDLEEQGLLLRLPCKVGTTVYNTTWWDDVQEKVKVDGKTFYRTVHKHKVSKSTFSLLDIYDFGKTIFLTKSEAEKKLKEMESD